MELTNPRPEVLGVTEEPETQEDGAEAEIMIGTGIGTEDEVVALVSVI